MTGPLTSLAALGSITNRRRRRLVTATTAVVVLLWLFLLPPVSFVKRVSWSATFGTWSETSAPPHIRYCGSIYVPAHKTYPSLSDTQEAEPARSGFIETPGDLGVLDHTPAGTRIVGPPAPAGLRCAPVLFAQIGSGGWSEYDVNDPQAVSR